MKTIKKDISKLSDDDLLNDFMYWIRVGRNENGLHGDERKHFKSLSAEVTKRRLLSV